MRDINANIRRDQILAPVVLDGGADATNSASVDLAGYRHVSIYALFGASGDTLSDSLRAYAELQHSDDDSTWVAVPDAQATNTLTGANVGTFADVNSDGRASNVYQTQYTGSRRYVRMRVNRTGTHTNGIPAAALAVRFGPIDAPVTQPTIGT